MLARFWGVVSKKCIVLSRDPVKIGVEFKIMTF